MTRRVCGSEDHFAENCPRGKGGGAGGLPPAFMTNAGGIRARNAGGLTWVGFCLLYTSPSPRD
eukprot:11834730-Alexandrium_andersonii.AAC.1